MTRTGQGQGGRRVDPDDVRELAGGLAFLALLGLGLFVNVLIG